MSKKSKALHGVIQLFLILFLLLYLSPLFLVGINAFKSYQEIMTDVMSLPSAFTLDNIKNVFHDMKYPATFLNTLIATVIGTLGIIVIASMGGYKMARVKTRYSRFCFLFCFFIILSKSHECLFLFGERLDAGDNRLPVVSGEAVGEQNHPFDFHAHAFAVQCRFAQVFHQSGGLGMIAPIQRGEGDGW